MGWKNAVRKFVKPVFTTGWVLGSIVHVWKPLLLWADNLTPSFPYLRVVVGVLTLGTGFYLLMNKK